MKNFEADFIPYYLTTRGLVKSDNNTANIIYSNDHDMYQCINDHCYQYFKTPKCKKIIKKGNIMKEYLKEECNFPDTWFPLAMSILGDAGDCVDIACKGFGPKNLIKVLEQLVSLTGGIEQIYEKVHTGQPIFETNTLLNGNKILPKIIEVEAGIIKNLKLVSFEVISKMIDDPPSTEMVERKDQIYNIIQDNEYASMDVMIKALNKSGIIVDEEIFSNLYYGVQ